MSSSSPNGVSGIPDAAPTQKTKNAQSMRNSPAIPRRLSHLSPSLFCVPPGRTGGHYTTPSRENPENRSAGAEAALLLARERDGVGRVDLAVEALDGDRGGRVAVAPRDAVEAQRLAAGCTNVCASVSSPIFGTVTTRRWDSTGEVEELAVREQVLLRSARVLEQVGAGLDDERPRVFGVPGRLKRAIQPPSRPYRAGSLRGAWLSRCPCFPSANCRNGAPGPAAGARACSGFRRGSWAPSSATGEGHSKEEGECRPAHPRHLSQPRGTPQGPPLLSLT